jgi:hypothetical protein
MPGNPKSPKVNHRSISHHHHEHAAASGASTATSERTWGERMMLRLAASTAAPAPAPAPQPAAPIVLDAETRERERIAAEASAERTRKRIEATLSEPRPDSSCPASPGQYCFPGMKGFHASRRIAAEERLAVAAAHGLGRGPVDEAAVENAERHQRQRGNPEVHWASRPARWWEAER